VGSFAVGALVRHAASSSAPIRGTLTFDLPAAPYAPRMARFRAEAVWVAMRDDLRSDMMLLLGEMVTEAIEAPGLERHDRIEVRFTWEPGSARIEVCHPAAHPDGSRESTLRDLVVSSVADSHGLSWTAGRARRWAELRRSDLRNGTQAGRDLEP
jgi:hypothetical protein